MKVKFIIDENVKDIMVEVKSNEVTQDILDLLDLLKNFNLDNVKKQYIGDDQYKKYIIKYDDTIRFYSENKKTYSLTVSGQKYLVRKSLNEIFESLDKNKFIKISSSEIVNLEYVSHLETYFNGTLKLTFKNESTTYVSRSCVKNLKNILGL